MDEQAQVAPSSGDVRVEQYQRDAERIEKWSIFWVLVAIAMWVWFLYLLLVPHESPSGARCHAPLFDLAGQTGGCYAEMRQWPALLGILALAVVPSIVGAATTLYAKILFRTVRHLAGKSA
ncbi:MULTISPECIES: hypothetical protein [unclassified Streptomyces]|uniref:hypothetical protein n=1 Tax=unclassified Streptomyces TaxID=2593676 RepID=UPI002E803769|nr:hypothetical protein [Streptomyces sp. NBC_00589]WTI41616.1 hypothetical protein OIC96_44780 [Streptomyces sp. NBC_00775]WUB24701.1 hypothetical protein OHA51_04945 [Streptomyces sp. NBC_00589]